MCERLVSMMELVGEIGRLNYLKAKIKEKISKKNNSKNISDELLEVHCIAREFVLSGCSEEYKRKIYEELQTFIYNDLTTLSEVGSNNNVEAFIKDIFSLFSDSVKNKQNNPFFIQQLVIDRVKVSIKNSMDAIKEGTMKEGEAISSMFRTVEKYVLFSANNYYENRNNQKLFESLKGYKEELVVLLINQKLNTNSVVKIFFTRLLNKFLNISEYGASDILNCLNSENDLTVTSCNSIATFAS